MKKFLTTIVVVLLSTLAVSAQGTVTVTHSSDIDALVNGNKKTTKTNKNKPQQPQQTIKKPNLTTPGTQRVVPYIAPPTSNSSGETYQRTKLVRKKVRKPIIDPVDGTETKHMVMKRVAKGVKKVRGFRVLAYSGGNTRKARQEAEKLGQKAKEILVTEPIYVHFYSPRWMCQVGNFTNYAQAKKVMRKLRKEGFTHANIIRTMVTIQTTKVLDDNPNFDNEY